MTPAAGTLEQAAVQVLPGCRQGRWDSGGRNEREGLPRVEKRAAKRGERSDFHSFNDTILDLLHILFLVYDPERWQLKQKNNIYCFLLCFDLGTHGREYEYRVTVLVSKIAPCAVILFSWPLCGSFCQPFVRDKHNMVGVSYGLKRTGN